MIAPFVIDPIDPTINSNQRDIAAWEAEMRYAETAIDRETNPVLRKKYEAFYDHCRKQIQKLKTRM